LSDVAFFLTFWLRKKNVIIRGEKKNNRLSFTVSRSIMIFTVRGKIISTYRFPVSGINHETLSQREVGFRRFQRRER
jgi:hypothetical protein